MAKLVKPALCVIVGPTATGKTALGIELAKRLGRAVVSADSRQVYAGMNIGTATPLRPGMRRGFAGQEPHGIFAPDVIDGVEHYLLNIRRPDDPLTLAQWQRAAHRVIDRLMADGTPPLLVGGTMLYIDSITRGYALPAVPPNASLRSRLATVPTEALASQLREQDPAALYFIDLRNRRRMIRALEVIAATGRSFAAQRQRRAPRYNVRPLGLFPAWPALRRAVEARARAMLQDGLLEEVEALQRRFGHACPLLATLNYRQASAVLAGRLTHDEAVEEMTKANMRYAHRQMSWWRKRLDIRWFATPAEALAASDLFAE